MATGAVARVTLCAINLPYNVCVVRENMSWAGTEPRPDAGRSGRPSVVARPILMFSQGLCPCTWAVRCP
jgi:hypothetical protein